MTTMTTAPAWGANYDRMSPAVRARCMADDREFRQAQVAQERERAARETYLEENRFRAAIEMAEQRGEYFSVAEVARTGGACIGRTRGDMRADVIAQQDLEDARARAEARRLGEALDAQRYQAALLALNPQIGGTHAENLIRHSALQDIEDFEAARRAQQGPAAPDAVAARQALQDRQTARYESRARTRQVEGVARGAAQRALRDHYEEQFNAGLITEAQLREAARTIK